MYLLIFLFSNPTFADNDTFFNSIKESHMLESRINKKSTYSYYKKTATDGIVLDNHKLKRIEAYSDEVEILVFDSYKKQFFKEFSKDEVVYIRNLYTNYITKKLIDFNVKFLESKEVKSILDERSSLLRDEFLNKKKEIKNSTKKQ